MSAKKKGALAMQPLRSFFSIPHPRIGVLQVSSDKPWLVGIYRGIIIAGFLSWCRIKKEWSRLPWLIAMVPRRTPFFGNWVVPSERTHKTSDLPLDFSLNPPKKAHTQKTGG